MPRDAGRQKSRPEMGAGQTFFGMQQTPGIVGSRRKNLHDEEERRERMRQMEMERRANGVGEGRGHSRSQGVGPGLMDQRLGQRRTQLGVFGLGMMDGRRRVTDGSGNAAWEGENRAREWRDRDEDVEQLGSLRWRSWSEPKG